MENLVKLGSELDRLVQENLFQNTKLGWVLDDVEFWEGGFSQVERVGDEVVFWVTGDNGKTDVTEIFLKMTEKSL